MSRCATCDNSCKYSRPTGPYPADVMLIGEKPGREEEYRGVVFVGDSGDELNRTYLPLASLDRSDVYVTNMVKCRLGGNNDKPTADQVRTCSMHHVTAELSRVDPSLIILLGSTACSEAAGVHGIELEKDHGLPFKAHSEVKLTGALADFTGWIFPMYHPAAGMHNTGMMQPMLDDWARLGKWRRGKYSPPRPAYSAPDYAEITSYNDLLNDFVIDDPDPRYLHLPVDTEDVDNVVWSLQYSLRPGHGRMIRDSVLQRKWFEMLYQSQWDSMSLHYANHDLNILEQVDARVERRMKVVDTMQEAYQLRNLPQGLKALAWRLIGVRMRDYTDVVEPHSRRVILRWLREQYTDEDMERHEIHYTTKVKQEKRMKVVWKESERAKRLLHLSKHAAKSTYDVWAKCKEYGIKEYPRKGIHQVPIKEAIEYACQDADMQGQLTLELARIRKEVEERDWVVTEEDWDTTY